MTARKPRKMPKNQRAYPKKGKPRLVRLSLGDQQELGMAPDTIDKPHIIKDEQGGLWIDASQFRKWRALRNPPTSEAKHG